MVMKKHESSLLWNNITEHEYHSFCKRFLSPPASLAEIEREHEIPYEKTAFRRFFEEKETSSQQKVSHVS